MTAVARFLRQNVIALLAVAIALSGTAYAANSLPKHSVGPKQLKKNAVSGKKVKDGSLTGVDLADGSVTSADVSADVRHPAPGTVGPNELSTVYPGPPARGVTRP